MGKILQNGIAYTGSQDLSGLSDVSLSSPQNNEILAYNSTTHKWENKTGGGGGGASDLDDLNDVSIISPTNNQVLKYNSISQEWENGSVGGWADVTGTLIAGQTSITLQDAVITTNSTVDVYVDDAFYGVNPTSVSLSTGSITLVFPEQSTDMPVKVRIS